MATDEKTGKRVLVVEDELMICMLLEGMLTDLGYTVAAEAGSIEEAVALSKAGEFGIGQRLRPGWRAGAISLEPDAAEAVPGRSVGAGDRCRVKSRGLNCLRKQRGEPGHGRLVGDVDLERRDRDA